MLLERELVYILEEYNIKNTNITYKEYVNYAGDKLNWCRFNYFLEKDQFYKKIEHLLNDCKDYGYIDKKKSNIISVTKKGRDFIKTFGFFEEYLKRRKRTVVGFLLVIATPLLIATIKWLLIK